MLLAWKSNYASLAQVLAHSSVANYGIETGYTRKRYQVIKKELTAISWKGRNKDNDRIFVGNEEKEKVTFKRNAPETLKPLREG